MQCFSVTVALSKSQKKISIISMYYQSKNIKSYGVLGKANFLIRSYLTDRKQIVVYENTQSITLIVRFEILH